MNNIDTFATLFCSVSLAANREINTRLYVGEKAVPITSMTVSASASTAKGRVLIVGATGFIGQFVAEASLGAGRPTYVLVRPGPVGGGPSKGSTIRALQDKGAIILHVKKISVSL